MRVRTLFWRVWDFLTYSSYRVKIKTYSNGTSRYTPQGKVRILPFWGGWTDDPMYGGTLSFSNEVEAIEFIEKSIARKPVRVVQTKVKYYR